VAESNDDLVNALESIKGLLEQSEVKLTAARKSIKQASESGAQRFRPQEAPEPEPEIEEIEPEIEEIEATVPVLEDVVIPGDSESGVPPKLDTAVLKSYLDEMQRHIEKNMRDTLMQAVVRAEGDLKKQIRAYLDQLRNMLDDID
jgi:hypothetical protein